MNVAKWHVAVSDCDAPCGLSHRARVCSRVRVRRVRALLLLRPWAGRGACPARRALGAPSVRTDGTQGDGADSPLDIVGVATPSSGRTTLSFATLYSSSVSTARLEHLRRAHLVAFARLQLPC